MKHTFYLLFIFSFFSASCFAEDADTTKIQLKVSAPDSVQVGKQFQVKFEFNANNGSKLKLPELEGLQIVAGPYTSTSMSTTFIDGKQSSTYLVVYTFVMIAEEEGLFTIGEASVSLNDKEYKNEEVTIKIVPNVDGMNPDRNEPRKKEREAPQYRRQQQRNLDEIFV